MGTTIVEEATTKIMGITIVVDSREIMEAIGEMDMLAIIITRDSIAQILKTRGMSAK